MNNDNNNYNDKTVEHESDKGTNCNWCSWYSYQKIGKRTRGLGNKRESGDHPNYSIVEIGQNIENKKNVTEHEGDVDINYNWIVIYWPLTEPSIREAPV